MKIKIFHLTKETGKILNKIMNQLLLMSYLHRKILKKYKSEHDLERENNAFLLIINDNDEKCYYFAVKSKLELYSSELL